jgi:hypothetical protein
MRIQGIYVAELFGAHIALPIGAVESTFGRRIFDVLVLAPFDMFVGDGTVQVALTNDAENTFAVKLLGARARLCLKVVSKAASSCVVALAEWARDVGATVDF